MTLEARAAILAAGELLHCQERRGTGGILPKHKLGQMHPGSSIHDDQRAFIVGAVLARRASPEVPWKE